MMMNLNDTNLYVAECRTQATNLLITLNKLAALKNKWIALDLGNALNDSDIGGENAGITKAQIGAVLGTTLPAIDTLLAAGHVTNLHTIAKI